MNISKNSSTIDFEILRILRQVTGWTDLVLVMIGLVGNFFILANTIRRKVRIFTKFFLISEAMSDSLVLVFPGIRYFVLIVLNDDIQNDSNFICIFHSFVTYLVTDFSAWILIILSLERYLLVKFPFNKRLKDLSLFHAISFSCVMFALGFLKNFIFFTAVIDPDTEVCFLGNMKLQLLITVLDMIFNLIIPSTLVLFCTIGSIIGIKRHILKISSNLKPISDTNYGSQILRMILAISVYHLITSLPLFCVLIIIKVTDVFYFYGDQLLYTFDLACALYISNNSLKFYLYCFSSKSFRKMFILLIHDVKIKFGSLIK
uniref:GCR118 n=1 Tax=Schmidtea mediterranea TaxID=79327 RepID=A0A193KUL6_SCHMD|nr:GCR118 [Schmidtea mediterranea]